MNNYNSTAYKTYDLALASALVAHGFSIVSIERAQYGGKATFIFERTDKLDEATQAYWADKLRVNPKAYFDVLKHIKTRIYSEA